MEPSRASPYIPVHVALSDVPFQPGAPTKPSFSPPLLDPNPWDLSPGLTQKLKDHDAVNTLQQLPLLSAIKKESVGGIFSSLVRSVLKHIVR